uniref:Uncharacterized protein n=1 Tax=Arundo donax TaxID=35708 RepID=A0A0A9G9U3_ARUDO
MDQHILLINYLDVEHQLLVALAMELMSRAVRRPS